MVPAVPWALARGVGVLLQNISVTQMVDSDLCDLRRGTRLPISVGGSPLSLPPN
jgi:hypothetical protein